MSEQPSSRQPIPFLGRVTEKDIQDLIRRVNHLQEDVKILTVEVQALKEKVNG